MKYITLIIGLLVVGCGKTAEEKVAGTYEGKEGEDTIKFVLLENGILEFYRNGKKDEEEGKWSIVDRELHIVDKDGEIFVLRINKDESITWVVVLSREGEREDIPKDKQETYKKIK